MYILYYTPLFDSVGHCATGLIPTVAYCFGATLYVSPIL